MSRKLTASSTLENLRREAKRWLRALRASDPGARARLEQAIPGAPADPTLRTVQLALAREYGFDGWTALKHDVSAIEAGRDDPGKTALARLHRAAEQGDLEQVRTLLDRFPHLINERGEQNFTALRAGVDQREVVRFLLERGADPNVRDEGDNAMPLHFAAERRDMETVRLLIEHGADPIGTGDMHELDVIGWATCFGTGGMEVAEYLLAHGARHNIFSAVAMGHVEAIRALAAESPASLNRAMDRTNHRRRPLSLAVVKKRRESLAALLGLGADAEATDAAGLTALDQAAIDNEAELARLLLDHGARLHLPAAIALGRTDDVRRLLAEDRDALKPGGRFGTLIVRASAHGSAHLVEALIEAGAPVNVPDDTETSVDQVTGYTALHAAAFHGNAEPSGCCSGTAPIRTCATEPTAARRRAGPITPGTPACAT